MPEKGPRNELGRYLALAQAGLEMVAPLVVGIMLDHYLDWTPWLTISGAVLGFAGGLTRMILIANRLNRENGERGSDKEPPV
jgi:F0F1-type ATP synthase assembly protein I